MSKTILFTFAIIFAVVLGQLIHTGLEITPDSRFSVSAEVSKQPSVGVRWSGTNARNQVTFRPAAPFLVFLGSMVFVVPMGLGYLAITRVRLA